MKTLVLLLSLFVVACGEVNEAEQDAGIEPLDGGQVECPPPPDAPPPSCPPGKTCLSSCVDMGCPAGSPDLQCGFHRPDGTIVESAPCFCAPDGPDGYCMP